MQILLVYHPPSGRALIQKKNVITFPSLETIFQAMLEVVQRSMPPKKNRGIGILMEHVQDIRSAYATGEISTQALGMLYGVSREMIRKVVYNQAYYDANYVSVPHFVQRKISRNWQIAPEIRKRYLAGESTNKIAKDLHLYFGLILKIVRNQCCRSKEYAAQLSAKAQATHQSQVDNIHHILELYNGGMHVGLICAEMNMSERKVRNILAANTDRLIRHPSGAKNLSREQIVARNQAILEDRKTGATHTDLVKKYAVNGSYVSLLLKKHGLRGSCQ